MATTRSLLRHVGPLPLLVALLAILVAACGANVPTLRPSGPDAAASPRGSALGASSEPTADSGLKACTGTDLKASLADWGGNSATRTASVTVTNKSRVTCTLRGRPGVRLLNGKNKILLDSAKIQSVGGPKVRAGDPIVVLGPGDKVSIGVEWTNWCTSQPTRPLTINLVLTDRGGLLKVTKAKSSGEDDAPKCTAKKAGSELRVTDAWSGAGL